MQRSSGILIHPTSFPGPFGIGCLGDEARDVLDILVKAGCRAWQVLPLGPTGYGDSPYASSSSFAGNELLIDPRLREVEPCQIPVKREPRHPHLVGDRTQSPVITFSLQ